MRGYSPANNICSAGRFVARIRISAQVVRLQLGRDACCTPLLLLSYRVCPRVRFCLDCHLVSVLIAAAQVRGIPLTHCGCRSCRWVSPPGCQLPSVLECALSDLLSMEEWNNARLHREVRSSSACLSLCILTSIADLKSSKMACLNRSACRSNFCKRRLHMCR